jgi:hypothetical protein
MADATDQPQSIVIWYTGGARITVLAGEGWFPCGGFARCGDESRHRGAAVLGRWSDRALSSRSACQWCGRQGGREPASGPDDKDVQDRDARRERSFRRR